MDYTYNSNNQQSPSETTDEYLRIPSTLTNFINTDTTRELTKSDKPVNCFKGYLKEEPYAPTCSCCGQKMHVNHHLETSIRHIPFGQSYNVVIVNAFNVFTFNLILSLQKTLKITKTF